MKDDLERADDATYEDEHTSRRTVSIPLKEYDELKAQEHFIKDPALSVHQKKFYKKCFYTFYDHSELTGS